MHPSNHRNTCIDVFHITFLWKIFCIGTLVAIFNGDDGDAHAIPSHFA